MWTSQKAVLTSTVHGIYDCRQLEGTSAKANPEQGRFPVTDGTLAFSIMLVANEATPRIIGWLGIVASVVVFLCNWAKLAGRDYKVLFAVSALLPISFEMSIGVWLSAASPIIP